MSERTHTPNAWTVPRAHAGDAPVVDEDATLYVVAVITNPRMFRQRYKLFKDFEARMLATPGIALYVAEAAYGARPHEVTDAGNPRHLQLRTRAELWHKENMVNLVVQRLPARWRYVAWIDADIEFVNAHWVTDTVHALQHYPIVQMFQQCIDLGPKNNVMCVHEGFAWLYHHYGVKAIEQPGPYSKNAFPHPGYAWAMRRDMWDAVGGLMDFAILGAADHHMALAVLGLSKQSIHGAMGDGYKRKVALWEERALAAAHKHLGYVPGTITHNFHGKKADRKYQERWLIMAAGQFDPERDLVRDSQGLIALVPGKEQMAYEIGLYFQQRNEDSIDE